MRRATYLINTYHRIFGISIHALLAESDSWQTCTKAQATKFLSTLSLRRATQTAYLFLTDRTISIHALLAESDRLWVCPDGSARLFLSTLSLRRATESQPPCARPTTYFYPRSPCGERHNTASRIAAEKDFYPRSPCGERRVLMGGLSCERNFYPRSPCGERLTCKRAETAKTSFLSTLSLRRATCRTKHSTNPKNHFYPRSPCGERHQKHKKSPCKTLISIHALLAESDLWAMCWPAGGRTFLSTLSLRRATKKP